MVTMGSSDASSSPEQVTNWNDPQQQLFNQLADYVKKGLTSSASFPGSLSVPQTGQETSYFDAVNKAYSTDNMATRQTALNTALSGNPAYTVDPEATKSYYQNSIYNPAQYEFNTKTAPGISEKYTGPGYWGSARTNALAQAKTELGNNLSSQWGQLQYQDEQSRRQSLTDAANRQQQTVTSATNAVDTGVSALGTAGQYTRAIQQQEIAGKLEQWLMGGTVDGVSASQYNPYINYAMELLGLKPYSYGSDNNADSWNFGVANWGSSGSTNSSTGSSSTK